MFKIRKKNTIVNKKIVGNREKIMKIYKRKKGCTIILWLLIATLYTYGALAAFSVFFFMYAFAGTAAVNCAFDYSAPTATVIIKNKEPVPVQMHDGLLEIKWYYSGDK